MDNKKLLKDLEEEYERIKAEYSGVQEEITLFEVEETYAEYESKTEEERKEDFPTQYARYEKQGELSKKLDELEQKILQAAQSLQRDIDVASNTFKGRIEQNTRARDELERETVELREHLKELKKTLEYKSGEQATHEQAEKMQVRLKKLASEKGKLTKGMNMFKSEINMLEEAKNELVAEYGEQVVVEIERNVEQENIEQLHQKSVVGNEKIVVDEQEELITKEQENIQRQISILENDLEQCSVEYNNAMQEIRELDQEIMALKATEEYQNQDESTLAKVKQMELERKVISKNQVATNLKDIRNKINMLKSGQTIVIEQQSEGEMMPVIEQEKLKDSENIDKPDEIPDKQYVEELVDEDVEVSPKIEQETNTEPKVPEKYSKKEFDELCTKAKKGDLTQEEFSKLAEIMKDEQNYDKLGITTGIIFNKSKSVLKAMAQVAAKTGNTARMSRERLGLAAEEANKENGYLSTSALKEWKGLKTLMVNPGQKIASEELFKKVVELDRETLTDEQKEVWDRANEHLNKFNNLKECLGTYQNVSEKRRERSWWWARKEEAKPLPEASNTPPAKTIASDLEGLRKDKPDYSEIKPKTVDAREQVKVIGGNE